MILVKNKLKKVKNKYEDDEYLNYLKYSHLEPKITTKTRMVEVSDKATQEPDILNNYSQTISKEMEDKETDTYDELNKIIGNYILMMNSKNFKSKEPSRLEKMTQAYTQMIEPKERKKSGSSTSSESEGFLGRNVRRGFRLAELTGNAVVTTFNVASDLADFLVEATAQRQQEDDEDDDETEDEEGEEIPSGSTDMPFRRERSRSRDDDTDDDGDGVGERLLRRGASRSRSSTPPKKKK